jgi:hypothetical protein
MKQIIFLFLIINSTIARGQIVFPKDFHCENVDYKTKTQLMYNGKIRFLKDRLDDGPIGVLDNYSFSLSKTKDGIYWGSGKEGSKYLYVLVTNDYLFEVSSNKDDETFSYYSTWLLAKVRTNLKSGNFPYFLDYKSNSPCN